MKLAVVGSREFPHMWMVHKYLDMYYYAKKVTIVSGGARGVDTEAGIWSINNRLFADYKIFHADWDKYGKPAGFIRNKEIVDYCDKLVAFWDGGSRGTVHSINLARDAGKLIEVIQVGR